MTDHAGLIRRLRAYAQERYLGSRCPNLVHEAADAIKELVARAEKAEAECDRLMHAAQEDDLARQRAEADLVAARKALRKIDGWSRVHTLANMQAIQAEANAAIASARAEGGEND